MAKATIPNCLCVACRKISSGIEKVFIDMNEGVGLVRCIYIVMLAKK
jgi:hypothetical protein